MGDVSLQQAAIETMMIIVDQKPRCFIPPNWCSCSVRYSSLAPKRKAYTCLLEDGWDKLVSNSCFLKLYMHTEATETLWHMSRRDEVEHGQKNRACFCC